MHRPKRMDVINVISVNESLPQQAPFRPESARQSVYLLCCNTAAADLQVSSEWQIKALTLQQVPFDKSLFTLCLQNVSFIFRHASKDIKGSAVNPFLFRILIPHRQAVNSFLKSLKKHSRMIAVCYRMRLSSGSQASESGLLIFHIFPW